MTISTPTVRRVLRRWLFWIVAIAVAVVVTLLSVGVVRSTSVGDPLSASSPTPTGAKALVEVLRQQGVTVIETTSLAATKRAATDDAAILVYDPNSYLADAALHELRDESSDLVLLAPDFDALQVLAPGVAHAGTVSGTRDAECSLPAAIKAGSITTKGEGYRATAPAAVGCFPTKGSVYSVVRVTDGGRTTTVVGAASAFENGQIAAAGNAALALNLLGERSRLLWYLPSATDAPGGSAPTLAELTPPWLTGFILLALLTGIAAALWRGRRLGALVIENLPVTVRASETMEGRARLYASSGAHLHALDALRIGTIDRLARVLGQPRIATVEEVVAAAASVSGDDLSTLTDLLVTIEPANDADLVRLSDDLLRLEARVAAALRPSRDPAPAPSGRE
jgi:Domain of unknown function (DUF4350)